MLQLFAGSTGVCWMIEAYEDGSQRAMGIKSKNPVTVSLYLKIIFEVL